MNPVIIIPTFCSGNRQRDNANILTTYDHMTQLAHQGELPRCLGSLRDQQVTTPIIVLVVAQRGYEAEAEVKIRDIATAYPSLDIRVAGASELAFFNNRIEQMGIADISKGVSLSGYGAMRNFGLMLAAIGGFDEVIFIDDDELVETPDFVERACYGLGKLSPSGIPIFAKTGFFIDKSGDIGFKREHHWYDGFWKTEESYNAWLETAMKGARLSRSNAAFGGCLAIHREAFKRISFDPYITRGEDTDYLLNMRMYGSEVWFDNQWSIRHLPPMERAEAQRFRQDIYRWLYESRKLEYSKMQIDLLQVSPHSLNPYPGPFLGPKIGRRIFFTALLRSIGRRSQSKAYFRTAMTARKEAMEYAMENCSNYYDFQFFWPEAIALVGQDPAMKRVFSTAGQQGESARLTGTFQAVQASSPASAPSSDLLDFDLDIEGLGIDG